MEHGQRTDQHRHLQRSRGAAVAVGQPLQCGCAPTETRDGMCTRWIGDNGVGQLADEYPGAPPRSARNHPGTLSHVVY